MCAFDIRMPTYRKQILADIGRHELKHNESSIL
jgi:hypothetical protein